jgi:hypothetical protein
MDHKKVIIPLKESARSLCWNGDVLIDWAGGNRVIALDGNVSQTSVYWSYRFDAAVQSPSGRFAVIYERLGTKGIVLEQGKFIREVNRSFYHANAYEYPIVLFQGPDGRELIAHCPDHYNQIEIEEAATGKQLTQTSSRKPDDFFQSRLAVSPGARRLLSAGWYWHPADSASAWLIIAALEDARTLDSLGPPSTSSPAEINSAVFIDDERIVVSSNPESDMFNDEGDSPFRPGTLAVFHFESKRFEDVVIIDGPIGQMMWLGDGHVVGFYEHPKVIDVATGAVVCRWPDIETGKQSSSIIGHVGQLPHIALDPAGKRFAVASADRVTVIQF